MITIRAFPRIHISLIDLAGATLRRYGGIGFSIREPETIVKCSIGRKESILGLETLDVSAQAQVKMILKKTQINLGQRRINLEIKAHAPQHVGLGSKTTLLLAILAAINKAAKLDLNQEQLQLMSERGSTSGIGIHAFFRGGLLADAGQPYDGKAQYGPSSSSAPLFIPPLISQINFPETWSVGLILASESGKMTGEKERQFYSMNTPIRHDEALAVISAVYHGIMPAAATADFSAFRTSLTIIHSTGFKRKELLAQDQVTMEVFRAFEQNSRFAIGLSSMGPIVFVLWESANARASTEFHTMVNRHQYKSLWITRARNSGFELVES